MLKRLTIENFENIVESEKNLFIIKFFSETCAPCKAMTPVFEVLDEKNPDINVYEVDTMESPELAAQFGVRGVPYIAYCEKREVLYEFTGATPLGSLQYVIDNIDEPYFRETGEFKQPEQEKSYTFPIIIGAIVVLILLAIVFK